jgi:hypothetical protein
MSIKVVGIPGSLREGSFNRGLLRTAIELAPTKVEIQVDKGNPEPVQALKTAIRQGRRDAHRDTGIQLRRAWRAQERHRLGITATGSIRPEPKACRDHGMLAGIGRNDQSTTRIAAVFRVYGNSCHAPTRDQNSFCGEAV